MNQTSPANGSVFLGTIGGTLSGICNVAQGHDVAQTAVLSAVGALVSFIVSYLLGLIIKKRKKS